MKKIIDRTSIFLLEFLTIILLFTIPLFFIRISITRYHFILSFIITVIVDYFINKKKDKTIKEYLKYVFFSFLIVLVSILVSTYMFDRSSDGNTYHKDAVGVLKEGFNPVYEESYDFIVKRDGNDNYSKYNIWTDHYAKNNWIIEANIYKLTNNIESAKAINLISAYIAFGIIFTILSNIKFGTIKSIILALITVINPVTGAQFFTFYNDQLVFIYLALSVLMLIMIDKKINDKKSWYIYIMSFIMLSNMKFNGMGYLMVFSFLFVCRYLYRSYKNKDFIKIFKKLCYIFIPLFIVSFLIVGYPTYVKNTLDHSNPVFPLYDKNGEDIITEQEPKSFITMNNVSKIFYGTFSKANNLRDNDNTTLKIPFIVYKDEIIPACSNDLRISGYGVLFSGLLIISIIILFIMFKKYKKESFILYTLGITILLMLVISESWWARYTPHFYFFILLSLYILYKYGKNNILKIGFTFLIIANTLLPLLGNTYYTFRNSISIQKRLNSLSNKEIIVKDSAYFGVFYNLKDYKIKFKISNEIEGKELFYKYLYYEE